MSPFSIVSEATRSPLRVAPKGCSPLNLAGRGAPPREGRGRSIVRGGSLRHADGHGDPLVAVPDRDLRNPGDLGDLLLRARLVAEDRGGGDRRPRGGARGAAPPHRG